MFEGPAMLTILEAARALGVQPQSVYDRIRRGTLAGETINGRLMTPTIPIYCEADDKCLTLLNELIADGSIAE